MADSLSHKLEEEHRLGCLPGIQIAPGVKAINHSQFTDDTLLLGVTSPIIARRFKWIMDSFLIASGGKINISKSRIYGWNIPGHQQDIISRIFGFPIIVNWKSFIYLGMLVFQSAASSQDWKAVLDKLASRIQSWGARWLNPTGKIVLIKSVLSALTIFQCAGLLAPKGILEKISKSLRGFLWEGGKINTKKISSCQLGNCMSTLRQRWSGLSQPLSYEYISGRKVGLVSHL
jgi:hypothetical protein